MGHEPRPAVRVQKKWRDRLIAWVRAALNRRAALFVDENWFVLWPYPAAGWAECGRPSRVAKAKDWDRKNRPPSCALYAGMDASDREVTGQWHDTWNQDETWRYLQGVLAAYGQRGMRYLIVFWDHGPWHVAASVRQHVAEHNRQAKQTGGLHVLLYYLPKKSPWLMPLEPVCGQTKRAVGMRERHDMMELRAAVERRLQRRNAWARENLKLCGYDALVLQGQAPDWCYLHISDEGVELRDARHLLGTDTWEMEDRIKAELGKSQYQATVYGIGPAGENLIKFSAIMGDKGHAAAHNGCGAVMGSKKVKAVAVARGHGSISVKDPQGVKALVEEIVGFAQNWPPYVYQWGTSMLFSGAAEGGWLPVRNLTTNVFPGHEEYMGDHYRPLLEMKHHPCWACQAKHCHIVKVKEGPYAGYVGEEPEYEAWSVFTSNIGQRDHGAAVMLSDLVDKLGMDVNEAGWVTSFAMECYERGVIGPEQADGLELRWGNVEAARQLLENIAHRQGWLGSRLADGIKRGAAAIGGEAPNIGVYIEKGHAPRGHDHRARWNEILDYATSGAGTIEAGPILVKDRFDPDSVAEALYRQKTLPFMDSLVLCTHATGTFGGDAANNPNFQRVVQLAGAVTGSQYSKEEALELVQRISNLLRAFNLRHGIGTDVEKPSPRYGSTPVDGPAAGQSILAHWDEMRTRYYQLVGWDLASGRPFSVTLEKLGLGWIVPDLWTEQGSNTVQ